MTFRTPPLSLSLAFVILFWALGAFGRDVLYNHNTDMDLADDKVGAVLPYVRVAASLVAVLSVVGVSGVKWALSKIPLSLLPFCLWTLLTVVWTEGPKDTWRGSLTLIAAWGAAPILIHRLGVTRAAGLIINMIIVVCVASVFVAVVFPSLGRHGAEDLIQNAHAGRWRGIFSHKNGLGPWAAYGTVLPLVYRRLGWVWPMKLIGACCGFVCLIQCGSATALALATSSFCLFVFFQLRQKNRPLVWPFTFAGGVVLFSLSGAFFKDDLLSMLGRSGDFSGRGEIWQFAWEYVRDHPWLGYGYATLGGADFRAREANLFWQGIPGPESGYLTLLLETGWIGCGLMLGPFLLCLVKGWIWLDRAAHNDRQAVELFLILLLSTFVEAVSESNALTVTGYDGVLFFMALFALSTAPWPSANAGRALRNESKERHEGDEGRSAKGEKVGAETEKVFDPSRRQTA